MNKWTIIVEEDKETGELLLPFSDELLEQVGWKIGDTIEWIDNKDGTWTMRKNNILMTLITKFVQMKSKKQLHFFMHKF
jgi:hypothetical protein